LQGLESLIFLAFLIAIFYFVLIRPQKRRVQAHRELVDATKIGDEVVTIGGVHGIVKSIEDDDIELEIASGVTVRFVKSAVARRVVDEIEEEEEEPEAATASGDEEV
jgi:preprotein translocase subunit YajC